MHFLSSRICSFPPSIPTYFINKFTKPGDVVFDPWCGKGTVPFEALRNERIGIGNDVAPEAFVMTHAKVRPISIESLQSYLLKIKKMMVKTKPPQQLTELDKKAFVFYSKKTFDQIRSLREVLLYENSTKALFTKGVILGILHGSSETTLSLRCSHSYSMSPNYVKKYTKQHGLRKPSKNVLECIFNRGKFLLSEPLPKLKGLALKNDSRKIKLESNSVDMILTSPPYFDVQTYAWANWLRLWFLGYDHRKVREKLIQTGSQELYRQFMRDSIRELYRVLKPRGKCFIVAGDVKLSKRPDKLKINTARFLLPLCRESGFKIDKIIVDKIPPTRRVMTYIPEDSGISTERILCLRK